MIRDATHDDIPSILSLTARIPELTFFQEAPEKEWENYIREYIDKEVLLVARVDDSIVGCIGAEPMLGGYWWVDMLAVNKDSRRQGVGSALLDTLRERAKQQSVKRLFLMAPEWNEATLSFYESAGMQRGKQWTDFTEDL